MLKSLLALVTAAVIAGLFVALVPPPAPVAAKTAAAGVGEVATDRSAIVPSPVATRSVSCREAWPYYEPACLRDGREPNSAARTVRVVARNR